MRGSNQKLRGPVLMAEVKQIRQEVTGGIQGHETEVTRKNHLGSSSDSDLIGLKAPQVTPRAARVERTNASWEHRALL